MKETADKPEGFAVAFRAGVAHVERNLEFGKDAIRLQLQLKPDDLGQASVVELHQLCLQTAIDHLQGLLNRTRGENPQA